MLAMLLTLLAQTLRMAVPYACAGLGGVWSERSGVANIALEGMLLAGGLGGVVGQHATGSAVAGAACGAAVGAAFGLAHALLAAKGRVDAIVSGVALNLSAAGGARFLLRALYDSSSNSPAVEGFRIPALDQPGALLLLARVVFDPLTVVTALLVAASAWALYRTRFGLRVRACGEDPAAAASVGVDVVRSRVLAITVGAAIAGVGGVALAFDQHQFQSGMSGGRGFIALAAVILSGWRPARAVLACLAFAALDALQILLQDKVHVSPYAVQAIPYVATLLALFVIARRRGAGGAPAGIGKFES
jgi:ABC-type uncharacterized transport system permease subunit